MERESKRAVGTKAESLAADYLAAQGVTILEKNYRSHKGEIDLVGLHGDYLIFVEVKYRNTLRRGTPEEAVGAAKQRTICRVADAYRVRHRVPSSRAVRYDVVAVTGEEVRWIQNAFPHIFV